MTAGTQRRAAHERALGRIASLVAEGVTPAALFDAVAREVARFLDVPLVAVARYTSDGAITVVAAPDNPAFPVGSRWSLDAPTISGTVLATGRPVRIDYDPEAAADLPEAVRRSPIRTMVAVPVILDSVIWGLISAGAPGPAPLPADTEDRLTEFTELIAVAISHAETQDRLQRLTQERAAVRRLAALVTGGAPAAELFAAVVKEVVDLLRVPGGALLRYEPNRSAIVLASIDFPGLPLGERFPLDGQSLAATILETGRPARIDDYSQLDGTIAASIRDSGFRSAFAVPIVVDGAVWGLIGAGTPGAEPLPADAGARLSDLVELLAGAISDAEARDRLRGAAEAQAALRRVATLVAAGAGADEVVTATVQEIERVLAAPALGMFRYEADRTATVIASRSTAGGSVTTMFPLGARLPLEGSSITATVHDTGQPMRIDDYEALPGVIAQRTRSSGLRSVVGVPILVDGRAWGLIVYGTLVLEPLPVDLEAQLQDYAELVAIAISRGQAHDDLRRLADEQTALRRVATRVAAGAPPGEIFAAVVDEVAGILDLHGIEMARYEAGGTATVIATSGDHPCPVGSSWTLDVPSVKSLVYRTGKPARIDDYATLPGAIAEATGRTGFHSAIGAPIIVDGAIWGAIIAFSREPERIPERAGIRLSQFTELVAAAVSNATARADLVASRARIVTAADEARRRVERDLHDGTQQRLLALGLDLQGIQATDAADAREALERAQRDLAAVLEEVREVGRGLHPAQLARGGLGLALRAVARRAQIPVELEVEIGERPPAPTEIAAYYIVCEAIANAIKHSQATVISVAISSRGTGLLARIADDGVGGAVMGGGSGLIGLADRIEALGGRFALDSPRGRGTTVTIELP